MLGFPGTHVRQSWPSNHRLTLIIYLTLESNLFLRNGTYPLMFIGRVFDTPLFVFTQQRINIFFFFGLISRLSVTFLFLLHCFFVFLYFCLTSFPKNGHIKCVEKNFQRLKIHRNIVLFINVPTFLFNSGAFVNHFRSFYSIYHPTDSLTIVTTSKNLFPNWYTQQKTFSPTS